MAQPWKPRARASLCTQSRIQMLPSETPRSQIPQSFKHIVILAHESLGTKLRARESKEATNYLLERLLPTLPTTKGPLIEFDAGQKPALYHFPRECTSVCVYKFSSGRMCLCCVFTEERVLLQPQREEKIKRRRCCCCCRSSGGHRKVVDMRSRNYSYWKPALSLSCCGRRGNASLCRFFLNARRYTLCSFPFPLALCVFAIFFFFPFVLALVWRGARCCWYFPRDVRPGLWCNFLVSRLKLTPVSIWLRRCSIYICFN